MHRSNQLMGGVLITFIMMAFMSTQAFALKFFPLGGKATSGMGSPASSPSRSISTGGGSPAEGFNIHVQAPHMMSDGSIGGPFHHYCKGISPQVLQCLLFKSTDPNAKLVAIEYFLAKDLARQNVPLIKWNRNFHDHAVEIATGRVQVLDMPAEKAQAVAEAAAKTDGIIFHLWHDDQVVPDGKVSIPNSVGHVVRTE